MIPFLSRHIRALFRKRNRRDIDSQNAPAISPLPSPKPILPELNLGNEFGLSSYLIATPEHDYTDVPSTHLRDEHRSSTSRIRSPPSSSSQPQSSPFSSPSRTHPPPLTRDSHSPSTWEESLVPTANSTPLRHPWRISKDVGVQTPNDLAPHTVEVYRHLETDPTSMDYFSSPYDMFSPPLGPVRMEMSYLEPLFPVHHLPSSDFLPFPPLPLRTQSIVSEPEVPPCRPLVTPPADNSPNLPPRPPRRRGDTLQSHLLEIVKPPIASQSSDSSSSDIRYQVVSGSESGSNLASTPVEWVTIGALGRGSFAVAYLVYNAQRGCKAVIKCVRVSLPVSAVVAEAIVNEVRTLTIINHERRKKALRIPFLLNMSFGPSNCDTFYWFSRLGFLHMAMEYCPGGDLDEFVGKLTHEQLRLAMAEITHGINYLHDMEIVHQDIKTSNIFIGQDGHCVIADFNASRECKTGQYLLTRRNEVLVVTPHCTAPEMVDFNKNDEAWYDGAVDWWSLGLMAFHLFTAEDLYADETAEDPTPAGIAREINRLHQKLKSRNCPSDLLDFITELLQIDPHLRLHDREVLEHLYLSRLTTEEVEGKVHELFKINASDVGIMSLEGWQQADHFVADGCSIIPRFRPAGLAVEMDDSFVPDLSSFLRVRQPAELE
ncbi:hypothetical protein JAAARDRAFT_33854 [Jaapia argillacea MUCL 33604]|uniref:non-specific serine/threonine protein kinase n=1 Tax=Jaapia argillacea MUCL 33604 TaxID=933084 RepID=A0A067Q6L4_9AGAM|nr:hypothetical protein JAAARDRAFT_33854 [Jaapia argillacea MUCL 33604]